ncbi:uracil DNA N-glycosylase [Arthroderma uncinatum]|uniref:uracil DNA N-glycosylase n=1 Tax=Arthroderma uncinatum TaxID=74035 RepID=UPI00144ABD42|nr:uracil DNA N-glycosylase [Arthroderma uncinatum]KAF3492044.1 uracil DNA N-glycosylase [Arthroderma uncinatum]
MSKRDGSHLAAKETKKPKGNGSITSFFGAPKTKTNDEDGSAAFSKSTTILNFNKASWAAKLTPEQRELLQLEIDTLDESWLAYLKDELVTKEFLNLKRFLRDEKKVGAKIFPPEQDIYSWSRYTPLHKVKAVIIGQDPYHNHGQAHGLCFSVRPPTPAPPSLKNIYIALKNDYPSFELPANKGGLLTPWAEQGVLLLNTCLTVRAHNANSHAQKGWERFTQKAIDLVAKVRTRGVVFLAWGSPAGKRISAVNRDRHCVLQSVHPSPLSAHRGFLNCGHFKKANDWLQSKYGDEGLIDWSLTPKAAATAVSRTVAATAVSTTPQEDDEKPAAVVSATVTVEKDTKAATSTDAPKETSADADDDSDFGQDLIDDDDEEETK